MAGRAVGGGPAGAAGGPEGPGTVAARSPVADILAPPVQSSAARPGWDRVLVELHRMDGPWEVEASLPFHLVSCLLRPPRRLACRIEGGPPRPAARLAAGDLILVPAHHVHLGAWDGPIEFLLTYVSPRALARAVQDDGFDAGGCVLRYGFQARDPWLATLLHDLQAQLASPAEDRLYVDTLGVQLAVHLLDAHGAEPLHLRQYRRGLSRATLRLVLDYLNGHLERNIQLAQLARLADMSPFHFLRLFRTSCGETPHHYLVRRRVEVAKAILLREDVPLAEVASRVGFADQSHFTRHFHRLVGAPPGRLRRAVRPG